MSVTSPTQAGFLTFIRNVMGISAVILPDDSGVIPFAYAVALATVNPQLACVCIPTVPPTSIYALAVYNLAGDRLLNYAQDLPNAPPVDGSDPPTPFFRWYRSQQDMTQYVSGTVQSTHDESTGVAMVVPDFASSLTIGDLANLKTPYGQQYLAFAQDFGPELWGIS